MNDENKRLLLEAKSKQVDIWLARKLMEIDEKWEGRNLANSGFHKRERGLAEIEAIAKKDEIKATLELEIENQNRKQKEKKYKRREIKSIRQKKKVDLPQSRLILYKSGTAKYRAPSGKTYQALFGPKDNSFLLLKFLIQQRSGNTFPYEKLEDQLNDPRREAEGTPESRVRNTVQAIRKKFNLIKKNRKDDFFLVEKELGLKYPSEIRQ